MTGSVILMFVLTFIIDCFGYMPSKSRGKEQSRGDYNWKPSENSVFKEIDLLRERGRKLFDSVFHVPDFDQRVDTRRRPSISEISSQSFIY